MFVTLNASRSSTCYEHYEIPESEPEIVELGPFEYVGLTYDFLRVGPEGDTLGVFSNGAWKIDGQDYPFSDLDIYVAKEQ